MDVGLFDCASGEEVLYPLHILVGLLVGAVGVDCRYLGGREDGCVGFGRRFGGWSGCGRFAGWRGGGRDEGEVGDEGKGKGVLHDGGGVVGGGYLW